MSSRKRKADEEADEMSVSPMSSPSLAARPLARPLKRARPVDQLVARPLPLDRLLETLEPDKLRAVLRAVCEAHPDIGREVVDSTPRPSVHSTMQVIREYQERLRAAFPYGSSASSSAYNYERVRQPLIELCNAVVDFTRQFLPPLETQASTSLEFLDAATDIVHALPEWPANTTYRQHKDQAYEDIGKAWALVATETGLSRGSGSLMLLTGGWRKKLHDHNLRSNRQLQSAVEAMESSVGWMGGEHQLGGSGAPAGSVLEQLHSGTYGSPVRVGPF